MFNSDSDRKVIEDGVKELSNSYTRVEAERNLQKEIAASMKEKTGLDKGVLGKLAKIYHNQSVNEVQQETDDLVNFYEQIFR